MSSLRRRLTGSLLVFLLLITGTGLFALHIVLRHQALESFDDALKARAQSLASMVTTEHGPSRFGFAGSPAISKGKSAVRFAYTDDGKTTPLAQSVTPPPAPPDALEPGDLGKPTITDVSLGRGRKGRGAYCTFVVGGDDDDRRHRSREARRLRLWVVEDRHELDETLNRLLGVVIGSGAMMALAVALFVPRLVSRGLRPLDDLARRAGEIDANALAERFPENDLPDELAAIVVKLNGLLARLEVSFERERRFSADISHELRTPVAELKSLAECARKWPDMRTEQTVDDMLGVVDGMEKLIGSMLALAACDNGVTAVRAEPIATGPFVREIVAPFREKADARRLILVLPDDGAPTVDGDPTLLKALVTNLVDNAVAYAPERSAIVIATSSDGEIATLSVANPAPDLHADDIARLFDGFWRKDASRTERHAGLGLTLAQSFARAMGMTLTAGLTDGMLTFSLRLPSADNRGRSENRS